ncbi:retinoic acid-induced protein [Pimephales promelas]|nr:retinoic acid-induced protein [Pimephales promelas]
MEEPPSNSDGLQPQDLSVLPNIFDLTRNREECLLKANPIDALRVVQTPGWFVNPGTSNGTILPENDSDSLPTEQIQPDDAFSNTTVMLSYLSRSHVFAEHSPVYGVPSAFLRAYDPGKDAGDTGLPVDVDQHLLQQVSVPVGLASCEQFAFMSPAQVVENVAAFCYLQPPPDMENLALETLKSLQANPGECKFPISVDELQNGAANALWNVGPFEGGFPEGNCTNPEGLCPNANPELVFLISRSKEPVILPNEPGAASFAVSLNQNFIGPLDPESTSGEQMENVFTDPESSSINQMENVFTDPESSSGERMENVFTDPESSSIKQMENVFTDPESSSGERMENVFTDPESSSGERMENVSTDPESSSGERMENMFTDPKSFSGEQMENTLIDTESSSGEQVQNLFTDPESSSVEQMENMLTDPESSSVEQMENMLTDPESTSGEQMENLFTDPESTSGEQMENLFTDPESTSGEQMENLFTDPESTSGEQMENVFTDPESTSGEQMENLFTDPESTLGEQKENVFTDPESTSGEQMENVFTDPESTSGEQMEKLFTDPESTSGEQMENQIENLFTDPESTSEEQIENLFTDPESTSGEQMEKLFTDPESTSGKQMENVFTDPESTSGEQMENLFTDPESTSGEQIENLFTDPESTSGEQMENLFTDPESTSGEQMENVFTDPESTSGEQMENLFTDPESTSGEQMENVFTDPESSSVEQMENMLTDPESTSGEQMENVFTDPESSSGEHVENVFTDPRSSSGEQMENVLTSGEAVDGKQKQEKESDLTTELSCYKSTESINGESADQTHMDAFKTSNGLSSPLATKKTFERKQLPPRARRGIRMGAIVQNIQPMRYKSSRVRAIKPQTRKSKENKSSTLLERMHDDAKEKTASHLQKERTEIRRSRRCQERSSSSSAKTLDVFYQSAKKKTRNCHSVPISHPEIPRKETTAHKRPTSAKKSHASKRKRKKHKSKVDHTSFFQPQEPEIKLKCLNCKEEKKEVRDESFSPYVRVHLKDFPTCTVVNEPENKRGKRSASAGIVSGMMPANPGLQYGRVCAEGLRNDVLVCCLCGGSSNANDLGDLHGPYFPEGYKSASKVIPNPSEEEDNSDSDPASRGNWTNSFHESRWNEPCTSPTAKKPKMDAATDWFSPPVVPLDANEHWLHQDCAVWAAGVFLVRGKLYGLEKAVRLAKVSVCSTCQKRGATLGCVFKGCLNRYHYMCAVQSGCVLNEDNFSMKCRKHKNKSIKGSSYGQINRARLTSDLQLFLRDLQKRRP